MRSAPISPIAAMNSSVVPSWSRTARASANSSSGDAARDGTGLPSPSVCASPSDDDTPSAPLVMASWASATIAAICFGRGGVAHGGVAHDDPAHRGVTDEEPRVHAEPAVDVVEPLAERSPIPRRSRTQRVDRHALDPGHHSHDVVDVAVVAERRDREPAVPAHDGRHAVQRRRRAHRVPQNLRVVVRVKIDEAGRDHQAVDVERSAPPARRSCRSPRRVRSRITDVGALLRTAGSVDDIATAEHDVEHPRQAISRLLGRQSSRTLRDRMTNDRFGLEFRRRRRVARRTGAAPLRARRLPRFGHALLLLLPAARALRGSVRPPDRGRSGWQRRDAGCTRARRVGSSSRSRSARTRSSRTRDTSASTSPASPA